MASFAMNMDAASLVNNPSKNQEREGGNMASHRTADELTLAATELNLNANQKLLLAECWRHLHIGQWEFFRALLLTFLEDTKDKMGKESVLEILRVVFDTPELFCKGSLYIRKPYDIYWLCAKLYREISDEDEKDDVKNILSDAEFRYLLGELLEIFPEAFLVIKELYGAFSTYRQRKLPPTKLSADGKQFLVNVFQKNPKHGTSLLNHLKLKHTVRNGNYLCLLRCLYEAFNQQLTVFEICGNRLNGEDDGSEEYRRAFYCLLQEFETLSELYADRAVENCEDELDADKFEDDIEKLILRVWQVCERGMLDRGSVYFAILCFKNTHLLHRFCFLENAFKNRIIQSSTAASAECLLRLIHDRNGQLNIKELCMYSIVNKVHFLECVLLNCVHLISCGEYILTCRFLQDPILCRLKPLVFLLAWSKVKTIPEVAELSDLHARLYSDLTEGTDSDLNAICHQLTCKAHLIKWILRNSCFQNSKERDKKIRNVVDILKNINEISDLNIVRQCIYLEDVDRAQLFSALQGRISEDNKTGVESDLKDMTLQQIRDQMLLRSFYILYDACNVVLNGTRLEQMLLNGSSDGSLTSTSENEEFYKTRIVQPLENMKKELGKLYPLTHRVEILENLFSFLFLSSVNINENWFDSSSSLDTIDKDCSEDDNNTGEMKDGGGRRLSKRKLKGKTARDHASSESASASNDGGGNLLSVVGFLINDLVLRDFLECIKESVHRALLTFNEIQGKEELKEMESLYHRGVASSVSFDTLSLHLSCLTKYVNEAEWRFQLVADSWLPKEPGTFISDDVLKKRAVRVTPELQLYVGMSDDESTCDTTAEDGTLTQDDLPATSKKELTAKNTNRRHHRKKSIKSTESKSLIYKMLASHDTLLNYCLHENLLSKAEQVIEVSGMKNSLKALEVEFASGYEKAVKKLQQPASNLKAQSPDRAAANSSVSAWDSIMKAANSARGTLGDETLVVDELLATYQVPFINEVNVFELKPILANWLPEQMDWRALVRADLALVTCTNASAAKNLLQSSYLSFRSVESPKSVRRSKLRDCRGGQIIADFIKEMLSITTKLYSEEEPKNKKSAVVLESGGIRGLLLQGLMPLAYTAHRKTRDLLRQLDLGITGLTELLEMERSILVGKMGDSEPDAVPTVLRENQKKIHLLYNRLTKSVTAVRNSLLEDRLSRKEKICDQNLPQASPAYLFTLYEYVSNLNSVTLSFENEFAVSEDYFFSILHHSPDVIIGRLLFDKDIDPTKLEDFATRLNVDLVQIIVECSCPYIPVVNLESSKAHSGKWDVATIKEKYSNRTQHWKSLSSPLLDYVENKCWLLAVIIRAMTSSSKPSSESEFVESSQSDTSILHPVLYRYLERRLSDDEERDLMYAFSSHVPIDTIVSLLEETIKNKHYVGALHFIDKWECHHPRASLKSNWKHLKNHVLGVLVSESCDTNLSWVYALRIDDVATRRDVVKKIYTKWSSKGALLALNACLQADDKDISTIIKQVEVCQAISDELSETKVKWKAIQWQEINQKLKVQETFLELLTRIFDLKKYDLVMKCSLCYPLFDQALKIVADSRVLALLQVPVIEQTTLHMALDNCIDVHQRFSVCLNLLSYICEQISSTAYDLLSVLEKESFAGVDAKNLRIFAEHKIGVKVFLCLAEDDRKHYLHLVKHSHILIEQLLIDIKIGCLRRAFEEIREDLKCLPDDSPLSAKSLNNILKIYATKAVDFRVVETAAEVFSVNTNAQLTKSSVYEVSMRVPTKSQWVPDSSVSRCMNCSVERFSMFNRRHHCRRCGRVVCGPCSKRKSLVEGYEDVAVRVCDKCYDKGGNRDLLDFRFKEKPAVGKSVRSMSMDTNSSTSTNSSTGSLRVRNLNCKLSTTDDAHNLTVREEFSYEQAPNIPLYLLIYDLYWDSRESANEHLNLAHTLLKFLQPVSPGVSNVEVDYNLVINMLKSVVVNAKVKFSKAFDNAGVVMCDNYLGVADLFKVLVSANCKHLIPGGDLNRGETFRKLFDELIREERWELALEVATKGGFDGIGVWASWGKVCLRAGYYAAARDKFSRCLKPLSKSNKGVLKNSELLKQILERLQTLGISDEEQATVVEATLKRLKAIRNGNFQPSATVNTDGKLPARVMSECLFYLEKYGNHAMNIEFYVNHDDWDVALNYILSQKCSTKVFIEEILLVSLRKGYFKKLLKKLSSTDPSLESWSSYLLTSCRYLESMQLSHALYELQVFLKDYVRAAFTCIKFYQAGSKNYVDLYDRLPHLDQAKKQLYMYQETFGQEHLKQHAKGHHLSISDEDLQKHFRSIDLQIDITSFLSERADKWHLPSRHASFDSSMSSSSSKTVHDQSIASSIPTVFGSSTSKANLFVMVVMSGCEIEEGFNLAIRILTEYRLNVINVCSLLAKKLIQNDKMMEILKVITCMKTFGNMDNSSSDKVILKAISTAVTHGVAAKEFDPLIKLIVDDTNKIEAYILCGKLKSAYLLAVKDMKIDAVQRISEEAVRIGQTSVKDLCSKWLILKRK